MDNQKLRNKIIGLGENSFKKSYYPELNKKIKELELFQQLFEKTNDLVIVIEPENNKVKYINNSVAKLFLEKENFIGTSIGEVLGFEFSSNFQSYLNNPTQNKFLFKPKKDSESISLETVLNEIQIGINTFYVAIIRDVSEHLAIQQKLVEQNEELKSNYEEIQTINEELNKAKEKAEESDRLKSAFLANMSHEIRTPMNAIVGFSGFLNRDDLQKEDREKYISIIQSSSNQLLNIITDIVDISKIEAGQLKIQKSDFCLNDAIHYLYSQFEAELHDKNKDVELKIHKDLPDNNCMVYTDQTRLQQVLINLISNAIKFTDHGYIEFGYIITGINKVKFYTKDTGVGIAPKYHQSVFNRFIQTHDTYEKNYGGTGLGLAISKGIVQLLNGEIGIESELHKGTYFWFEIPLEPSDSNTHILPIKKEDPKSNNWSEHKILIAEDEEYNFIYLHELLKETNVQILRAHNGSEAVDIFDSNENIDLILMDIKMPGINGFEATQIIKNKNKDIPIIAQTAYALSGDREKALEMGCDDYLSKPVKKELLLELIAHYL